MKSLSISFATSLAVALVLSCTSSKAATTLMFNFSSTGTNDLTAGQATTLGVNAYQNVRTGSTNSAGTTATLTLDGITGSVQYADYWQSGMLGNLGQPYATAVGGRQIGSTGNQALITLNGMNAWMTANSFTSYELVVYYAGQTAGSENLATTPNVVSFLDGSSTTFDTITVSGHGTAGSPALWSGTGTSHTFTSDTLTIDANYINNQPHGIAAIRIVGVPEPSAALLGMIGGLVLLRRRRA